MEMTYTQIIQLHNVLSTKNFAETQFPRKLALRLGRLALEAEKHVKVVQDASRPSDEFQAYNTARRELAVAWARKDAQGNPVLDENGGILVDDPQGFRSALQALQAEHQAVVDAQVAREREVEELRDEVIEFQEVAIPEKLLPDKIAGDLLRVLSRFVQEE